MVYIYEHKAVEGGWPADDWGILIAANKFKIADKMDVMRIL